MFFLKIESLMAGLMNLWSVAMFNFDGKYVTFKGPFGSINYGIERMFKSRNVPNRG